MGIGNKPQEELEDSVAVEVVEIDGLAEKFEVDWLVEGAEAGGGAEIVAYCSMSDSNTA